MTAVDTSEAVATTLPVLGAEPGRPARPWEWQRGVLRRLDNLDGYVTDRTGLPVKLSTVKLVGLALAGRCNKEGVTNAAHSTLARDTALGLRAVHDAVAALEAFGWVRVHRGEKRGRRTQLNRYYLAFPATSQVDEGTWQVEEATSRTDLDPRRGGRRAGQGPSATPDHMEVEEKGFKHCGECDGGYAGTCRDEQMCLVALWKAEGNT